MRLTVNGLEMPADFPAAPFERMYIHVRASLAGQDPPAFEHFSSAWNALSFRYLGLVAEGDDFTRSITSPGGAQSLEHRYIQERHLFGFFSNGFSAFESYFYGMFAIGALIRPAEFSLITPKDQQSVSPISTDRAYSRSFPGSPILTAFGATFADAAYREWREVRNVLTHRTAPGRTIFVSIGSDDDLPPLWKINNIPLDSATAAIRRTHAARMLSRLLEAAALFVEVQFI